MSALKSNAKKELDASVKDRASLSGISKWLFITAVAKIEEMEIDSWIDYKAGMFMSHIFGWKGTMILTRSLSLDEAEEILFHAKQEKLEDRFICQFGNIVDEVNSAYISIQPHVLDKVPDVNDNAKRLTIGGSEDQFGPRLTCGLLPLTATSLRHSLFV
ncbi:hypothetical protein SOVF_155600 [Spinacia oleracea]|nr:hypothetical protein SOVF_155600 [Spinacia oleracea]